MPIITIQNLRKSFEEHNVFQGFNLEVERGEIIGLEGETGSGKTTLFRCITGLEDYTGSINIEGEISYLFQDLRLLPWLNIRKNILLPLKLKGEEIDDSDIMRMEKLGNSLGIKQHLDKEIGDISGGQKQRVLILRALITDPDILLMDEPFKSLDKNTRINSYKEVIDICEKKGKTVLIASHYRDIEDFTDRTIKIGGNSSP